MHNLTASAQADLLSRYQAEDDARRDELITAISSRIQRSEGIAAEFIEQASDLYERGKEIDDIVAILRSPIATVDNVVAVLDGLYGKPDLDPTI